jgi:hypothetical protein
LISPKNTNESSGLADTPDKTRFSRIENRFQLSYSGEAIETFRRADGERRTTVSQVDFAEAGSTLFAEQLAVPPEAL